MYYILSSLLFLISPLSGVLLAFIYVVNKKSINNNELLFFIMLFSLFMGVINSGKLPESDLLVYQLWFEDVKNYSLFEYIFFLGREPLFFLYNYIIYYCVFGNFEAYLLLHTFICYMIMGFAILRMHNAFKSHRTYLITTFVVLFLFPNLFTLSIHLMRQFLATSILLLFVVDVIFYNKRKLVLFSTALLIHTSSILMVVLYILNKLKSNKYILTFVVLAFFTFSYFLFKFADVFFPESSEANMLSYGISRIQNRVLFDDLQEKLSLINFVLFFFMVFVFYKLSTYWKVKRSSSLLYLSLMFLIFISVNYSDTEFALRFSFYMYFLFPISVYFFLNIWDINRFLLNEKLLPFIFLFIFSIWFVFKLYNGAWKFQHLESILFSGFW